jgi:hypothetical protein
MGLTKQKESYYVEFPVIVRRRTLEEEGVDTMTALQTIGHKSAHRKRYNTVAESDLPPMQASSTRTFPNTLITPADSTKTAQAESV